jgi:outer membrane receptor protein involved in Fe transport
MPIPGSANPTMLIVLPGLIRDSTTVRPLQAFAVLAILPAALGQVDVMEPLSVSATRDPEPISQVPYTVEMIPGAAFTDTSSLSVDDALRASTDFSLFRRNDSMTANPTSQGVSLRGLSPSGASRSLVLLDGVPLNDPFGGWVPWSLVPVDSIASAEIVPGGGASVWGNTALAGVIQLFSARPLPGSGDFVARAGDFGTRSADLAEAVPLGPGTLELRGEDLATDGTGLVAPASRGPVDIDAASRHNLASAAWRGSLGRDVAVVATLRSYDEWRDNGTPYQQNTFRQLFASLDLSGRASTSQTWSLTGYVEDQDSSQTFSAVNAARTAETPASNQFDVPTTALGLAATSTWTAADGGSTTVGADARDVRGETREDYSYSNGAYADQRFAGGRQTFAGAFVEQSEPLGPALHAIVGLRVDRWENSDGHLRNAALSNGNLLLESLYPTRTGTEFSPSGGLTWQATPELEFHAGAQRAFREPTLNELYRPFRQGNTTTLANAALATEHADTGEIGITWKRDRLTVTAEGFAARLADAVSNVTLAQGPGTFPLFGTLPVGSVGQERLNIDRVETVGAQLGVDWRPSDAWKVDLSVIDEEATVGAAAVAPALVGTTLPEVPRYSASLGVTWHPERRVYAEAQVRRTGSQFDDSQNLLPLAPATVIDASIRFIIASHAEIFMSVDNIGNAAVETAHSALGVYNVGPPRAVGGGARISW